MITRRSRYTLRVWLRVLDDMVAAVRCMLCVWLQLLVRQTVILAGMNADWFDAMQ